MGKVISPAQCHRISLATTEYFWKRFENDEPDLRKSMPEEDINLIDKRICYRGQTFGDIPDQWRLIRLGVLQEDANILDISQSLGKIMDQWMPKVLTNEIDIEVSNRPAAPEPCAQTFECIGERYVLSVEHPYVSPAKSRQLKWAEVPAEILQGPTRRQVQSSSPSWAWITMWPSF